jgi:hypothetical protein
VVVPGEDIDAIHDRNVLPVEREPEVIHTVDTAPDSTMVAPEP